MPLVFNGGKYYVTTKPLPIASSFHGWPSWDGWVLVITYLKLVCILILYVVCAQGTMRPFLICSLRVSFLDVFGVVFCSGLESIGGWWIGMVNFSSSCNTRLTLQNTTCIVWLFLSQFIFSGKNGTRGSFSRFRERIQRLWDRF